MKIDNNTLLNIIYDLLAQNPIAGVYRDNENNAITHNDLTNHVYEVDNENKRIEIRLDDEHVILQMTTSWKTRPTTEVQNYE